MLGWLRMTELPVGLAQRSQVEAFQRRHRIGVVTLLFTDLVGFTRLKQELGDTEAVALIQSHHDSLRAILARYPEGEEVSTAGDAFFIVFAKPSDAVRFALALQAANRGLSQGSPWTVLDRVGIHAGEVVITEGEDERDLLGLQVDTAARIMGLAEGDQVLLSRFVFDNARHALKNRDLDGLGPLAWLNHGEYALKGVEEPVQVCEVGETGSGKLRAPADSEKARRLAGAGELVLGWRPAPGQKVPGTQWVLEQQLGEGGFGEVWLGIHERLKEKRVFKFCFRADRVRSLKREVTLFRVLKERVGQHPGLVTVHDVFLDEAPYYLVTEYVPGVDLRRWHERRAEGGRPAAAAEVVELIAQTAEALQAAHDAGVIHRDIKPSNILVVEEDGRSTARLTDFGIGQVVSREVLGDMTKLGFTLTLLGSGTSQTGTQIYMAPEILAGGRASPRSDIYSLGVVFYQLLTGDLGRPVTADWAEDVQDPLLREDLRRCLAGRVEERYSGPGELARHLRALEDRRKEATKREADLRERERAAYRRGVIRAWLAAGAVVALMGLLAGSALHQSRKARANARAAEEQRLRTQELLDLTKLDQAQSEFDRGRQNHGLAILADVLRTSPSNRLAATKAMMALANLDFRVPLTRPLRHERRVTALAFSPDGQRLLTASADGMVRTFDAGTGTPLGKPLRHEAPLVSAVFRPNRDQILAASTDGTVQLWDGHTRKPAGLAMTHAGLTRIAVSADGRWAVTAGEGNQARVWDLDRGVEVASLPHEERVRSVHFSADGRWLATGSDDRKARIWQVGSWSLRGAPLVHTGPVADARFNQGATSLATATADGVIVQWDIATGEAKAKWGEDAVLNKREFTSVAFVDRDGEIAALGKDRHVIQIVASGKSSFPSQFYAIGSAHSFAVSPDGTKRVTCLTDNRALVLVEGEGFLELHHATDVLLGAFDARGERVATADADGVVFVWGVGRGGPAEMEILDGEQTFVSFPVVAITVGRRVRLWDLSTGETLGQPLLPDDPVTGVALHVADHLALTISSNSLSVWDWRTGLRAGPVVTQETSVATFDWSSDSRRVLTADTAGEVRIWDVHSGGRVGRAIRHGGKLTSARFNPDSTRVLTAGTDGHARLWDARSGDAIRRVAHQGESFATPVLSPEGGRLVTGLDDKTAVLWDMETGERLAGPLRHEGSLRGASFSPDGSLLATAAEEKAVRLWEAKTGALAAPVLRPASAAYNVAFSPDGAKLLATCDEGVFVWDVRTGVLLQRIPSASFPPGGFRADSQALAVFGYSVIRLFECPTLAASTPPWLPEFLESIAGFRYAGGQFDHVRDVPLAALAAQAPAAEGDLWAAVLRWQLSDRDQRSHTPFSRMSSARYLDGLLAEALYENQRTARVMELASLRSNTPVAMALLANREGLPAEQAQALCQRATELDPDNPWIWATKAQILSRSQDQRGAVAAVDRAIRLAPDNVRLQNFRSNVVEVQRRRQMSAKLACLNNLRYLNHGLARYRAEHGDLPPSLSDLFPAYLQATNRLLCPLGSHDPKTHPYGHLLDTQVLTDYVYEFTTAAMGSVFQGGTTPMQEWKRRQVAALGGMVPALRCFWHEPTLNLALNGRCFESPVGWENVVAAPEVRGGLGPEALREKYGSDFVWTNVLAALEFEDPDLSGPVALWDVEKKERVELVAGRSAGLPRRLLDLSTVYNALLATDWHNPEDVGNNLASLPTGRQTLGGQEFDIRGVVQLSSIELAKLNPHYPREVSDVPVALTCAKLHFLHGLGWPETNGIPIARYVIHYADGGTNTIDVVYGRDVRNWQYWPQAVAREAEGAQPVWQGPQERWKPHYPDWGVRLYLQSWINPRPDVAIVSLDLKSAMTKSAPFIVAITAE